MSAPCNSPAWKVASALTLTPVEKRVLEYIRNDAEDADYGLFSRASTIEVARKLGLPADAAYKALASLARKKLVEKGGRIPVDERPGEWQGPDVKAVGWQLWEVDWKTLPEGLIDTKR